MSTTLRQGLARVAVACLTMSAAGFAAWQASEGDGPTSARADGVVVHHPYVPTAGDVPTIGHGSTRYEDGTPVRLSDPPITRQRAQQLARNLHSEEEARFKASLPGVLLYQGEYDLYLDFVGQYGIGNWRTSSMRRHLMAGDHVRACEALPQWRFQAGRDCRLPQNWGPQGCKGVWTRQQKRHADCMAMQ
ncbi:MULTISPECIES: glycoside hydrolase family protein [unclassified Acidovorax]|uniref:glycoside hydrolase family protein n=1 Tax=unclassified Acidovorax TaxID=2684926 RepID=UPI001C44C36E|nr:MULTISPECIES: glycoside hydrolase family protein [unclassified Acidovorax]MBV7460443.1 glycoside hydrolase family protein [Acidovorax sp. sif0632]MBV7465468.1 glycoside hydrolase family protein [Acidovorax sp. sif0613]